jgi:hypothetical protein
LRRRSAIAACFPTIRPACGPPSSLSPEKVTTSTPLATAARTRGSSSRPGQRRQAVRIEEARAEVEGARQIRFGRELRELARADFLGEALHAEVEVCTFMSSAVRGPSAAR